MKKLLLILCALLVMVGCSTSSIAKIDTNKVFTELTSDKADSIVLSINAGTNTTDLVDHPAVLDNSEDYSVEVQELIKKQNASTIKVLDDMSELLKDAKFEAIETTEIKESNLVYLVRNKTAKVNFYIYNDGNVKMIYELESYGFKLDKSADLVKLYDEFFNAYNATSEEINKLLA